MGYRNYSTAVSHIVDATGQGDFTTIGAANAAATSGDDIFIRPGTYAENVVFKAGLNIVGFGGDALQGSAQVVILGTSTFTAAGALTLSNLQFQTNGGVALVIGGGSPQGVTMVNCSVNCTNNTGISFSNSNVDSAVVMINCIALAGTSNAFYTHTSNGQMFLIGCFSDENTNTQYNNNSSGIVRMSNCFMSIPFSSSATGNLQITTTTFVGLNAALSYGGTGFSVLSNCFVFCTAGNSLVTVGAGATLIATNTDFNSPATNVLTGAGTLKYAYLSFSGTSAGHNVTTETALPQLT